MSDTTQDDDRRDTAATTEFAGSLGARGPERLSPYDFAWDQAIAAARKGDPRPLVGYVTNRSGFPFATVEDMLLGESDEAAALLCRAARLPWESFEGILTYRARRYERGPGSFGAAIRLFRDTSAETAGTLVRRWSTD